MMSCSIVDDPRSSRVGVSINTAIIGGSWIVSRTPALERAPGHRHSCRRSELRLAVRGLLARAGSLSPSAELVIVDLIAQHDVEPDEQLSGDGDLRPGPPSSVENREIAALELGVRPDRVQGRLAEDPAEQGVALFGDPAESACVGGGIDGRRQADIADDVLAAGEAGDGAQDEDRGFRAVSAPTPGWVMRRRALGSASAASAMRASRAAIRGLSHANSSKLSSRRRVACRGSARPWSGA
jgi:hypothetical protein